MQPAAGTQVPEGTRGPQDDFFCLKYQVWYRLDDCVYRGVHKTYAGCVNCFQGMSNIRSREMAGKAGEASAPRGPGGTLLPLKR